MLDELEKVEEKATEVIEEIVDNTRRAFTRADVRNAAIGGVILGSLITGAVSYLIGRHRKNNLSLVTDIGTFEPSAENPNQLTLELDAEQLPELRKRWTDDLNRIDDSTIVTMREPETIVTIREEPGFQEEAATTVIEHISGEAPTKPHKDPDVEINVFEDGVAGWTYEIELKHRTDKSVYVIHRDEFWANEEDYTQSTLTYYAGDQILCDEDDSPIYNHQTLVGELRFGHGSGDSNVVYIRNITREAEYEVLLDPGSYTMEVLGIEAEKASDHKGPPKYKPEK